MISNILEFPVPAHASLQLPIKVRLRIFRLIASYRKSIKSAKAGPQKPHTADFIAGMERHVAANEKALKIVEFVSNGTDEQERPLFDRFNKWMATQTKSA